MMNESYIEALLEKKRYGKVMRLCLDNINNWSEDDYQYLYAMSYKILILIN